MSLTPLIASIFPLAIVACAVQGPYGFAHVEYFAVLCNAGEQHIDEWALAIECQASLVFVRHDALNCRQVSVDESVVLVAIETFPALERPSRMGPIIHNPAAYKCLHRLRSLKAMKEQAVAVTGAFVDGKVDELRFDIAPLILPSIGSFRGNADLMFRVICHLRIWERP